MAKGNDLIRYITEQVVDYMMKPKEERKSIKDREKEHWQTKWFGMLPFGVSMWAKDKKKEARGKKKETDHSV